VSWQAGDRQPGLVHCVDEERVGYRRHISPHVGRAGRASWHWGEVTEMPLCVDLDVARAAHLELHAGRTAPRRRRRRRWNVAPPPPKM